jgi:hypothetical protein
LCFISEATDAPILVLGIVEIGVGGSLFVATITFFIRNKYDGCQ